MIDYICQKTHCVQLYSERLFGRQNKGPDALNVQKTLLWWHQPKPRSNSCSCPDETLLSKSRRRCRVMPFRKSPVRKEFGYGFVNHAAGISPPSLQYACRQI
jgi:hypothetical protein